MIAGHHFPQKKPSSKSILPMSRSTSRTKQWRHVLITVPRCTLVADPIDLTTGGEGAKTPMRKLTSKMIGACSSRKEQRMSRKSKQSSGMEKVHPFSGLSRIHPHAAGVDIGAIEIVACV